ncbi:MAG: cyclic nucleotide-binding domain-containing protein [Burkholderiales bacterium]|nr:cyclic nucleotide-binding domain-containing protein [Burkholderiales bacterium]MDE1926886.1 cyclic nucleotide-binding domain-containing protein [Burkholderiales bacterium]MDE2505086.1 cyclic nucleotide-binding domain-containing protein [Burkholderiales bacterium]
MARIPICKAADIPSQGMKSFDSPLGIKVLIAQSGDTYYGYQGICPHQDVCLDEGFFDGATLTCHQHLWQWDITTGAAVGLAEAPLERFVIEQEAGQLFVLQSSALKVSELFRDASDAVIARLDALARREVHDSLATLYDIGDPADDVYVLETGRVEFAIGREDRTMPAGFMLRKGEVFGWAALLEDHPRRIAKAACVEQSTLLRLNGAEVLKVLAEEPASGYLVMRQLSTLITKHLRTRGGK